MPGLPFRGPPERSRRRFSLKSGLQNRAWLGAACLLYALMARIDSTPPPLILLEFRATRCCRSSVVEHPLGKGEVDCSIQSGSTKLLSPSTRHIDLAAKLADYFRLPSIAHYLIVDPHRPRIVHHARRTDDTILTRIVNDGTIELEPPGLKIAVAEIYAG